MSKRLFVTHIGGSTIWYGNENGTGIPLDVLHWTPANAEAFAALTALIPDGVPN